jgi:hypothetical protein
MFSLWGVTLGMCVGRTLAAHFISNCLLENELFLMLSLWGATLSPFGAASSQFAGRLSCLLRVSVAFWCVNLFNFSYVKFVVFNVFFVGSDLPFFGSNAIIVCWSSPLLTLCVGCFLVGPFVSMSLM